MSGISNDMMYACGRLSICGYYKSSGKTRNGFGTAFFVFDSILLLAYIVTCRHNVDPTFQVEHGAPLDFEIEKLTLRTFNTGDQAPGAFPLQATTLEISPDRFIYHADPLVDLAVCRVEGLELGEGDHPYLQYLIPTDMFLSAAEFAGALDVAERLVLPGYPRWYDRNDDRPIVRTGTICSVPRSDYRHREGDPQRDDGPQQMLYEAFSFQGNSGSPVFVEGKDRRPADTEPTTEPRFVGVNLGHLKDEDGNHAGLSRLVKAPAVLQLINQLRAEEEPPDFEGLEVRWSGDPR